MSERLTGHCSEVMPHIRMENKIGAGRLVTNGRVRINSACVPDRDRDDSIAASFLI